MTQTFVCCRCQGDHPAMLCPSGYEQEKNAGRKDDTGKPRWDLLPFASLSEVVEALTYGANKYTQYGECSCSAANVTKSQPKLATCAECVTTSCSSAKTQRMPSGNGRTAGNGPSEIELDKMDTRLLGTGIGLPENIRSQLNESKRFYREVVRCAGAKTSCASTTTTAPESSEDAYASHAMSASDGSKKRDGSTKHDPTCPALKIVSDGASNWRKVPNARSRYLAAAFRHLVAWAMGEKKDRESGLHHLAHSACCLFFLMEHESLEEK